MNLGYLKTEIPEQSIRSRIAGRIQNHLRVYSDKFFFSLEEWDYLLFDGDGRPQLGILGIWIPLHLSHYKSRLAIESFRKIQLIGVVSIICYREMPSTSKEGSRRTVDCIQALALGADMYGLGCYLIVLWTNDIGASGSIM